MSDIHMEAFFQICAKCGKHGSIFWIDGRQSFRIGSKEMGLRAVSIFRDNGHLSLRECSVITEQIVSSLLSDEITEFDSHWFRFDNEDYVGGEADKLHTLSILPRFGQMTMTEQ
ncbi:hypothetical protein K2Q02_01110 [Patescibacteria group bacterium]|nr:hypothetical protein [Patescibacteria group bacterium]